MTGNTRTPARGFAARGVAPRRYAASGEAPSRLRALLVALGTAVAIPAFAGDRLPVAPPPREVRPDGSRDPVPTAEDPAAVVERIIANAKKASDKLAAADAGDATRATQDGILKDIDVLLDPPDSPPKGGGGESNDMNKQDKGDGKSDMSKQDKGKNDGEGQKGDNKSDKQPNPGKGTGQDKKKSDGQGNPGGTDQKGGMDPGGMGQKDGHADGRRPRAGAQKNGKEPGGMAQAGKDAGKQPMTPTQTAKTDLPKDPAGTAGAPADTKSDRPPPPLSSPLPLADAVAKEVWGHLPERLRLQMTQHYREEFMPRYAGLLRQYYSSLSSSPTGPPAAPR